MSNIEKIRQEIEKWIYNTDEWEVSPGKYNKSESETYKLGWRCGLGYIREFIDTLPEEKPIEKDEEMEALIACDIMEATVKRVNIDKQDKDKEEEAMLEKINYLRNLGLNE